MKNLVDVYIEWVGEGEPEPPRTDRSAEEGEFPIRVVDILVLSTSFIGRAPAERVIINRFINTHSKWPENRVFGPMSPICSLHRGIPVVNLAAFFSKEYLGSEIVDALLALLSLRLRLSEDKITLIVDTTFAEVLRMLLPIVDDVATGPIKDSTTRKEYLAKYGAWSQQKEHHDLHDAGEPSPKPKAARGTKSKKTDSRKSKTATARSSETPTSNVSSAGASLSASLARKQRAQVQSVEFVPSAVRTRNFRDKIRDIWDSNVTFEPTSKEVQCWTCKVWVQMNGPYKTYRFKQHSDKGCEPLLPPPPPPNIRTLDEFKLVRRDAEPKPKKPHHRPQRHRFVATLVNDDRRWRNIADHGKLSSGDDKAHVDLV
ncbi:hypothetical protein B0H13DRAFT_1867909 [Mycena leptocephala]|nr:hypothetical protein B0H13DRAFT_1867909 [Mycena leptocephala]